MHRTLVLDVVGLTPELVGDARRTSPRSPARARAPAAHDPAGGHVLRAGDAHDRAPAARARDRGQRLVLPRPGRGLALAPVEPAGRAARRSGRRRSGAIPRSPAPSCSGGTTCTARRLVGHAAADVPGRRAQAPRRLHAAGRAAGRAERALGPFPLFQFWGPSADIASSRWIADCARHVYDTQRPTLTLVYLPHLDYDLQRLGPARSGASPGTSARSTRCAAS